MLAGVPFRDGLLALDQTHASRDRVGELKALEVCETLVPRTIGLSIAVPAKGGDPCSRTWTDLAELQQWTDERVLASAHRRRCSATGTSVFEAWQAEQPHLGELPDLPEPFDLVATRRVTDDSLVCFEGRRYSVPFHLIGRTVEARGVAGRVRVLFDTTLVAEHRRHTRELLVIDPSHYEGEATEAVLPPTPLGRMGRRLQEIALLAPERRPLDLYAALAEVAR